MPTEFSVQTILWLILAGFAVAAVVVAVMRLSLGKFVQKLLEENATSPETARSLSELGVKETGYLRSALKGRGPLSAVVQSTGEGQKKYYIPEESVPRAKSKFKREKFSIPIVLLCLLLLAAAAVGAAYLWPGLTGLWSRIIPTSC